MIRYKHIWKNLKSGKIGTQESDFVESQDAAIKQYWEEYYPAIYQYEHTITLSDNGEYGIIDMEEFMEEIEVPLTRCDQHGIGKFCGAC